MFIVNNAIDVPETSCAKFSTPTAEPIKKRNSTPKRKKYVTKKLSHRQLQTLVQSMYLHNFNFKFKKLKTKLKNRNFKFKKLKTKFKNRNFKFKKLKTKFKNRNFKFKNHNFKFKKGKSEFKKRNFNLKKLKCKFKIFD